MSKFHVGEPAVTMVSCTPGKGLMRFSHGTFGM